MYYHLKKGEKLPEGIDTEYLSSMIKQVRCKNNGMYFHVRKKGFKDCLGTMLHGEHLSLEYLQEKTTVVNMLLDTIEKDILLKSGVFRKLKN